MHPRVETGGDDDRGAATSLTQLRNDLGHARGRGRDHRQIDRRGQILDGADRRRALDCGGVRVHRKDAPVKSAAKQVPRDDRAD